MAEELYFTREQAEAFAAGLHLLASADGVHEHERELIDEFLAEAGAPDLSARLDELRFDPVVAYEVFETTWMRSLFLKAALLVIRVDGDVSEPEKETVNWVCEAFGVAGGYEELSASVEGETL